MSEMSMNEQPLVTVIMPVRNEASFIERSLGAVLAQDYPPQRLQILIVDGMSDDTTRKLIGGLAAVHPEHDVAILDNPRRIAPCALNIGLAQARGEIVVRVDGHCEIAPDYVAKAVAHLRDPETSWDGVGGPLTTLGATATARAIAVAMGHRFGVGGSAFRTASDSTADRQVDTVAFPAYSRQVLETTGAFDEELIRNQDDEYNYRLRSLGGKLLLTSDLQARYYSRGTFARLWRQYFQYGVWKIRVLQKHPKQMQPRQFVPFVFVMTLALGLLVTSVLAVGREPAAALMTAAVVGLVLSAYGLVNLVATLSAARSSDVDRWRLSLAFVILHVAYGCGFVVGLMRFAGRWRDRRGQVPVLSMAPASSSSAQPVPNQAGTDQS